MAKGILGASRWSQVLGLMAIAGVVTGAVVWGQQKNGGVMKLTAQDYIEIQMLGAKYAYGLDTAADNGNYFANVFTPDGSFGNTKGRDALAAMAREGGGRIKFRSYQHLVQNVIIEPTADGATGSQYIQVMTIGGKDKPPMLDHGGRYEDVYVKTAEGWRIKTRKFAHTFPPRE